MFVFAKTLRKTPGVNWWGECDLNPRYCFPIYEFQACSSKAPAAARDVERLARQTGLRASQDPRRRLKTLAFVAVPVYIVRLSSF